MKLSIASLIAFAAWASATTTVIMPVPTPSSPLTPEQAMIVKFEEYKAAVPPLRNAVAGMKDAVRIGQKWIDYLNQTEVPAGFEADFFEKRLLNRLADDIVKLWTTAVSFDYSWFEDQSFPIKRIFNGLNRLRDDAEDKGLEVEALSHELKTVFLDIKIQMKVLLKQIDERSKTINELESWRHNRDWWEIENDYARNVADCPNPVWTLAKVLLMSPVSDIYIYRFLRDRAVAGGNTAVNSPQHRFTNSEWADWYQKTVPIALTKRRNLGCPEGLGAEAVTAKFINKVVKTHFATEILTEFEEIVAGGVILDANLANVKGKGVDQHSSLLQYGRDKSLLSDMEYRGYFVPNSRNPEPFPIRRLEKRYNVLSLGSNNQKYVISDLISWVFYAFNVDKAQRENYRYMRYNVNNRNNPQQRAAILARARSWWADKKGTMGKDVPKIPDILVRVD